MNRRPLLLCTDLDRTLIPNGCEPESPEARPWLRRLVAEPDVTLVYVTGRHRALVEAAIAEYDLPVPDYVIGDVGTSLHAIVDGVWERVPDWETEIATDWAGPADIADWLADFDGLRMQEREKQGPFKLSYYTPADLDPEALRAQIRERLERHEVRANLISNAHPEVRDMAVAQSRELDLADWLYCAQGGWRGLNGNYGAGILEGVAHFRPDLADRIGGLE